jgi:hypothetical protein
LAESESRLAANNEWIKYIAIASYDVMWDWDIDTGEIYAGDSVKEVFGYTVHNNITHFNNFCECLIGAEKGRVKTKIGKRLLRPLKYGMMLLCSNIAMAPLHPPPAGQVL